MGEPAGARRTTQSAPPEGTPTASAAAPAGPGATQAPWVQLLLECRGVVQGVGFRPAVHRLAARLGLGGSLHNSPGLVRLTLRGERGALERFLAELPGALPPGARLEPLEPCWLETGAASGLEAAVSPAGSDGGAQSGNTIATAEPEAADGTSVVPGASAAAAGRAQSGQAPLAPTLTISSDPEAASSPLAIGLIAPSLAADRAPCGACLQELNDPRSRRHGDPFLSCCACGPRFTIATAEPWRRANTSLAGFRPCPACAAEFADPSNRRFHSETISCPRCGPRLSLLTAPLGAAEPAIANPARQAPAGEQLATGRATLGAGALLPPPPPGHSAAAHHASLIEAAAALLERGQILALQGVGGFQLLVDASDRAAVGRLRRRKRRPAKPLALLVADPAWIAPHVHLEPAAVTLLRSPAAPIVLLPRRSWAAGAPAASDGSSSTERWPDPYPGVAPGSTQLGVMLPASPLHALLISRFGRPLVCTSGNRSGEPLCIDPVEALDRLAGIADAFLIHNRPIARPLDDSVAQLIEDRPALLRRARGYAPEPLELRRPLSLAAGACGAPGTGPPSPATMLALGGDLKAAPALALAGRIWLAPHLGDLGEPRCWERFRAGIAELLDRHGERLERLVIDRHPGYLSHRLGLELAGDAATIQAVQHHAAHALAVVAEHGLVPPWLAFCADGLGYGTDPVVMAGCSQSRVAESCDAMATGTIRPRDASVPGAPVSCVPVPRAPEGPADWRLRAPISRASSSPLNPLADHLGVDAPRTADTPGERSLPDAASPVLPQPEVHRSRGPGGAADPVQHGVLGASPPLWGGELLAIAPPQRAEAIHASIERLACLRPMPLPGGDRAAREPRRVALGLLAAAGPGLLEHPAAAPSLRAFRDAEREVLMAMLARGVNCPWSSSLGRLFDGVASLLGLCQRISHEGEAGLRLQGLASQAAAAARIDPPLRAPLGGGLPQAGSPENALRNGGGPRRDAPLRAERAYPFPRVPAATGEGSALPLGWLDWQPLLEALLNDRAAGESAARCALRFHQAVAEGVADLLKSAATRRRCRTVVLAGGCFQNALLLEELLVRLRHRGLEPHIARAVPGNDGGLAVGQLWASRPPDPAP